MRIISGIYGGTRIHPPAKMPFTRPTTDVAREGLFNILENNLIIPDLKTLDLFGGTGCISYELASRGANDLTIIEKDTMMSEFIKKTSDNLKLQNFKIKRMDVFKFLDQGSEVYDLIFAGPPYSLKNIDELPQIIIKKKLLKEKGWFILEHTPANNYKDQPLYKTQRNYGTTVFSIFTNS